MLRLQDGDILDLKRERKNRFDSRAIALVYKGTKVGFVPRHENGVISSLLDQNVQISAYVLHVDYDSPTWERVFVELRGSL